MEENNKKRIGIDARFYGPIGKGLGRYTQEVVDNIIRLDNVNEYVVFLRKDNFDELVLEGHSNVRKVLSEVRWYSFLEQFLMPWFIWREKLDLVHFPHFNVPFFVPTKFIVTIHDLILTKFETIRATTLHPFVYKLKNWGYRLIIKRALRNSEKIITVSNFTKNDIIQQFGTEPEKIVVIYEGVANLSRGRDSLFVCKLDGVDVLEDYNIDNPFLLYVGNAYPHKNLNFLITAFFDLHKEDNNLRLVLVGKEDYFYKGLKDFSMSVFVDYPSSPVIFTGYIPDNKLEIFYEKAIAYVFPSLYEGFGLPPLEAMARGCPVISSDQGSIPEVLGDAAIYFNPHDKIDFIDKFKQLFCNIDIRNRMIERGRKHQGKYNWWDCAFNTWQIYLEQLLWK